MRFMYIYEELVSRIDYLNDSEPYACDAASTVI